MNILNCLWGHQISVVEALAYQEHNIFCQFIDQDGKFGKARISFCDVYGFYQHIKTEIKKQYQLIDSTTNLEPLIVRDSCDLFIRQFIEFVKLKDIHVIIVSEDVTEIGSIICEAASRAEILSIHIPHYQYLGRSIDFRHSVLNADYVFVGGSETASLFKGWGVREERIRITGNPSFDRFFNVLQERSVVREQMRNKLDLYDAIVIGFFTTYGQFDQYDRTLFLFFCELMQFESRDKIVVIIKDRPGRLNSWQSFVNNNNALVSAVKDKVEIRYMTENIEFILPALDLVISILSNVAIDAAFFSVPQIIWNPFLAEKTAVLEGFWVFSDHQTSDLELRKTVEELRSGSLDDCKLDTSKFEAFGIDGNSGRRVCIEMSALCGSSISKGY